MKLRASFPWSPGTIFSGEFSRTTVKIPGLEVGQARPMAWSAPLPDHIFMMSEVVDKDTVRVTLFNVGAEYVTVPAGVLSC